MTDLDLWREMEASAARARLKLLQDPSAVLVLVASGGQPDFASYWEIVRKLRAGVRTAARAHWSLIQDSHEWREIFGLARRWCFAQLALGRLSIAGIARRCHVVDIVDIGLALRIIREF